MAKKLTKNQVRRIEKTLSNTRPDIPPAGTNHVDDSSLWTDNAIYSGEIALNIENGEIYTQDGTEPVALGREDGIISGLTISTSGVSTTEINVSAGFVRLKGRTYKYNSAVDVDDASISIASNVEAFSRLDAITIKKDLTAFDSSDRYYGVDFEVFKGDIRSDIPVPTIPEDNILLGFVLVVPNATAQDVLRPLPVTDYYEGQAPLNVSSEQFSEDLKSRIFKWEVNKLFLKDQVVYFDNNVYKVAFTHVSGTDITTDINSRLTLTSMGGMTNSNISVFSHVGSDPTVGSWITQYFDEWNANTRILDAFYDISAFINRFAPNQPNNIASVSLSMITPSSNAGISTLGFGNVATYVVNANSTVGVESSERFIPYNSGTLKSYLYTPLTSYTTTAYDLSNEPDEKPNVVQVISDSNVYTFSIERDDHYGTQAGFKGFYDSIYANAVTAANLTPSANSYRFNFTHLSSTANTEITFYVEDERTPNVANVDSFTANTFTSVKYMSGVPILKEGDLINFDFDLENAVRYFYREEALATISSEVMLSDKLINFGNTEILSASNRPPFTELSGPGANGPVISFANVNCVVGANVVESSPQFTINGYNALDNVTSVTTTSQGFLVDDLNTEVGIRLFSGDGDYPAGTANVNWGNVYTSEQSQANVINNQELQYFGGRYFYPKTDYNTLNPSGIGYDGTTIEYPNYSNTPEVYRWSTFYIGDITDQKYTNFEIRDTSGINYDLNDGIVVTDNLKVYLKVNNSANVNAGTGWLNMNNAYNSTLITNPVDDGDPALDLSWMEGNPNFRRATFGTEERTGNVYVRVGMLDTTMSFRDVVVANVTPEENDSLWNEFNLGYIEGESYVIIQLNGTNNTVLADFLNGTTMSSNFDLQLRVIDDTTPSNSTDWIDANESYPANSFKPVDYGDPAVDLTYYAGGIPDATVRKITFGPTTRTGNLTVRARYTGDKSFGNVALVYPEL